jgi:hypothetical protein
MTGARVGSGRPGGRRLTERGRKEYKGERDHRRFVGIVCHLAMDSWILVGRKSRT